MHESATRERARGRWKILRNALLFKAAASQLQSTDDDNDDTEPGSESLWHHSIHCFAGFHMIPEPCPLHVVVSSTTTTVQNTSDDNNDNMLVRRLRQELPQVFINAPNYNNYDDDNNVSNDDDTSTTTTAAVVVRNNLVLDLECSLAAWQALRHEQQPQPLPADSDNTNASSCDDDDTNNFSEWTIQAAAAGSRSVDDDNDDHSIQSCCFAPCWSKHVAETLQAKGYQCTFTETSCTMSTSATKSTTAATTVLLARLKIQPCPGSLPQCHDYTVQRYTIPSVAPPPPKPPKQQAHKHNNVVIVLTRERRSPRRPTITNNHHPRQRRSQQQQQQLRELTSHVHHDGIDNTGNICVWDCERTLTWAVLLQSHCFSDHGPTVVVHPPDRTPNDATGTRRDDSFVVLELGSGMAALAALSLAAQWSNNSQIPGLVHIASPMHVYITDGHDDSVFNNQVNVRLMQSAGLLPNKHVSIECRKLRWTIEEAQSNGFCLPMSAHITLVSDCTHFVEYHAELYWTAIHHTRVGGQIWMCQPHRGDSWLRFVHLVHHVNDQDDAMAQPLVSLVEPMDIAQHLQSRHEEFQRESSVYNANIHRPHVFILTKLREATESDRVCVLQYQQDSRR
jgi:hypothetical protein